MSNFNSEFKKILKNLEENIQDKNASLAAVLSIIGVMFIPIGVIYCKKAITISQKIPLNMVVQFINLLMIMKYS